MAIKRALSSSVQSGLPSFDTVWDGRSAVGSMEPISAITLSASQLSVEFNNIPGTYSHLQLRCLTKATHTTDIVSLYLRVNNDSASNYDWHQLYVDNNSTIGTSGAASASYAIMPQSASDNQSANVFSPTIIDIIDYANTNKYKTLRSAGGWDNNGTGQIFFRSGLWRSTSAITSIAIFADAQTYSWKQYSSFSLYGIK